MKDHYFEVACVQADGDDIRTMMNSAVSITRATFVSNTNNADRWALEKVLGYHPFPIGSDWFIGYYKGFYLGRSAYILKWSGIEHIFTRIQ